MDWMGEARGEGRGARGEGRRAGVEVAAKVCVGKPATNAYHPTYLLSPVARRPSPLASRLIWVARPVVATVPEDSHGRAGRRGRLEEDVS